MVEVAYGTNDGTHGDAGPRLSAVIDQVIEATATTLGGLKLKAYLRQEEAGHHPEFEQSVLADISRRAGKSARNSMPAAASSSLAGPFSLSLAK